MRRLQPTPGQVGRLAMLAVVAASLVFVASASAQSLFGIAVLKDCVSPINVGDAYSCNFSFLNTVQSSHNTVFISSMTDTVGSSPPAVQTTLINSTTIGATGNSNGWSSTNTACDPTGCTVTFPGEIDSPLLSHYTTVLGDFPVLGDTVTMHWRSLCDVVSAGCSTGFVDTPQIAQADINPIQTTTATTIHDASHAAVTSVNVGTTVHDFVSVSPVPANNPTPTGSVSIDWFTNGACSGSPAASGGPFALVGGQVDATAFNFTPMHAGQFAFQAHYLGDGNTPSAFTPSDGPCEPLNVVDAFIQISPQNATNHVGATHTLTITVNANPATGTIAAGTATASILASSTTGSFVGSPTCSYPGGVGSSSCTVQITSTVNGETDVQATSDISQTGVTGSLTRTTGTAANVTAGCLSDCGNAVKHWVDAFIQITPQNATNAVGTNHVLTITVNAVGGGVLASGTATASIVTPPSTTGSFVGSPTCNYTGGAATASCTVTITSTVSGLTQVQASSDIGFTNAAGTVTRTTGTADNVTAGCTINCGNANKNWVDAFIQITPQNATNPAGTNHVLTITVNATGGGVLASGTATASIVTPPSTTGSFVGSPTCNYTGGAATASCTVTITSTVSGLTQVQATSTIGFTNAAGTVTRTTGTADNVTAGCTSNCNNANKNWADVVVITHVRDAAGNDITGSTTVTPGTVVHDEATVTRTAATPAAVPNPTGTVTFTLFDSLTCTGTVEATDPNKPLDGTGLATSATFTTPTAGGPFSYLAHYNGDANYPQRDAGCEPFTVQAQNFGPALTPGFWKTHEAATTALLPVSLGNYVVDTFAKASAIFDAMKCSAPINCLAGHLLAAELDLKGGSNPSIQPTIDKANAFLSGGTADGVTGVVYTGVGNYTLTSAQKTEALALEVLIDAYTNQ